MKILFISLGCDKNLADSEEMLGLLTGNGHEIVDSEEEADAIVMPKKKALIRFLKWQNTKKPGHAKY